MSEIVENLEETLLELSNVDENYSKADIDCIVNSMKSLVQMVKIILSTSSETSKQFKRSLSQTSKKLDESELYIKHLENRLHKLEDKHAHKPTTDDVDMENTGAPPHEECRLDSPLPWLDEIDSVSSDESQGGGGGDDAQQQTQSQPDMMSHDAIPPPPSTVSDCLSPDVENIQKYKDDFNQFKQHTIEETCRRTVLWSNFPSQIIETIKNRKESLYPLLRTQLKAYDLEHILSDSKKITVVGKTIKVEYLDTYRAGYAIRHMRTHIGLLRQEIDGWGADHHSIVAAQNIRFTRLTAAKYHKPRKTLEELAKKLKKARKINFFDIFVLKNKIYLRTCWKKQEIIRNTTCTRPFINKRVFTYYDEILAQKILKGEIPVEEREGRLQDSRRILSSGLGVDYAWNGDYIYGGLPDTEP